MGTPFALVRLQGNCFPESQRMNNDKIAPPKRVFTCGGESHAPIPSPPIPGPAPIPPAPTLPGDPQPPIEEPPPEEQQPPIGDPPAPPPPAVGAASPLLWQSVAGEEDPGSALDMDGAAATVQDQHGQACVRTGNDPSGVAHRQLNPTPIRQICAEQ
jgi:hypothetical protein